MNFFTLTLADNEDTKHRVNFDLIENYYPVVHTSIGPDEYKSSATLLAYKSGREIMVQETSEEIDAMIDGVHLVKDGYDEYEYDETVDPRPGEYAEYSICRMGKPTILGYKKKKSKTDNVDTTVEPLQEATQNKGGQNTEPETERPEPPQGQGIDTKCHCKGFDLLDLRTFEDFMDPQQIAASIVQEIQAGGNFIDPEELNSESEKIVTDIIAAGIKRYVRRHPVDIMGHSARDNERLSQGCQCGHGIEDHATIENSDYSCMECPCSNFKAVESRSGKERRITPDTYQETQGVTDRRHHIRRILDILAAQKVQRIEGLPDGGIVGSGVNRRKSGERREQDDTHSLHSRREYIRRECDRQVIALDTIRRKSQGRS